MSAGSPYSFDVDKDVASWEPPSYAALGGYKEDAHDIAYFPGGYGKLADLNEAQQAAGPGHLFVGGGRRRRTASHRRGRRSVIVRRRRARTSRRRRVVH